MGCETINGSGSRICCLGARKRWARPYDKHLYKARHLIENFFCKLKQFRAIVTRYDKTARNFLAAVQLASAVIWLN
jgi:transposase